MLAEAASGKAAWHAVVRLDALLARQTVYRLLRCRSVLNRISCSTDALAFLEGVNHFEVRAVKNKNLMVRGEGRDRKTIIVQY